MAYDRDKQLESNAAQRRNPTVGDYWEDHLAPVAVVLAVSDKTVTLCQKTKDAGQGRWTWDLTQTQTVDRDEFDALFAYESMPEKTWADVHPGRHAWAAEWWEQHLPVGAPDSPAAREG